MGCVAGHSDDAESENSHADWRTFATCSGQLFGLWDAKLGGEVSGYYLQRMETKWGSRNHRAGNIRLNTELVKKPKDLLEYVIVHEMLHLIEPTHSDRFVALLTEHYPAWREARAELNELRLTAEVWKE